MITSILSVNFCMYDWYLNPLPMSTKSEVELVMNFGEPTYMNTSIHKTICNYVMDELYESEMFENYRKLREYCVQHGPHYQNDSEID